MADDKKPGIGRAKTLGPRDRDVFVPKTPPTPTPTSMAAVQPPIDWTEDTAQHELDQLSGPALRTAERADRDDTPVGLEVQDVAAELRARARIKETNNNVKEVQSKLDAMGSTSGEIATMRTEMTGHVDRLEQKIVEVKNETTREISVTNTKIDKLTGHIVTAVGAVNSAVSQLNQFQGVVIENKLEQQKITFESHADVVTNQQKLADRDKADAQKQRRSFWYKVGSAVLKILGASGVVAATAIATHYVERC